MIQKLIDAVGGRKALLAVTCLILGVALAIHLGDVPANLLSLIQFILGAFVTGNVVNSAVYELTSKKEAPAIPEVDLEPLKAKIDELNQVVQAIQNNQAELTEAVKLSQNGLAFLIEKVNKR